MAKVIRKNKSREMFRAWKQGLEIEKRIKAQQEIDKEKLERFLKRQKADRVTIVNGKLVWYKGN